MSVVATKIDGDLYHLGCAPADGEREEVFADPNDDCANCGSPLGKDENDDDEEEGDKATDDD
jgi:hypothetical protein